MQRIQNSAAILYCDSQALGDELANMQDSIHQKEFELQQAKERIQKLEADLDDCRNQILRSIPTYEISDAWISAEFTKLSEGVSNWVEGFPDILHFPRTFNSTPLHIRGDVDMFPQGLNSAQTEIMTNFIVLWKRLFQPFLVALSSSEAQLLKRLYHNMYNVEPKKVFFVLLQVSVAISETKLSYRLQKH